MILRLDKCLSTMSYSKTIHVIYINPTWHAVMTYTITLRPYESYSSLRLLRIFYSYLTKERSNPRAPSGHNAPTVATASVTTTLRHRSQARDARDTRCGFHPPAGLSLLAVTWAGAVRSVRLSLTPPGCFSSGKVLL